MEPLLKPGGAGVEKAAHPSIHIAWVQSDMESQGENFGIYSLISHLLEYRSAEWLNGRASAHWVSTLRLTILQHYHVVQVNTWA